MSDEFDEITPEEAAQPEPSSDGFHWVGAPDRPEAKEHSDGISDLFEVDTDAEMDDVDDLVEVDFDKDIIDANEDGTLDDLVDVKQEDIMGAPPQPRMRKPKFRAIRPLPPPPPTGMSGIGY